MRLDIDTDTLSPCTLHTCWLHAAVKWESGCRQILMATAALGGEKYASSWSFGSDIKNIPEERATGALQSAACSAALQPV